VSVNLPVKNIKFPNAPLGLPELFTMLPEGALVLPFCENVRFRLTVLSHGFNEEYNEDAAG